MCFSLKSKSAINTITVYRYVHRVLKKVVHGYEILECSSIFLEEAG